LKRLAGELGVADRLIWQESTSEIAVVYNALDVLVSSSQAEGLPNVVARRWLAECPASQPTCGDSRALVCDCGIVVPPQNAEALAEGIVRCLSEDRDQLGRRARNRIIENFSTQSLASVTAEAISALTVNGTSIP